MFLRKGNFYNYYISATHSKAVMILELTLARYWRLANKHKRAKHIIYTNYEIFHAHNIL